jgi:hypothetical protein
MNIIILITVLLVIYWITKNIKQNRRADNLMKAFGLSLEDRTYLMRKYGPFKIDKWIIEKFLFDKKSYKRSTNECNQPLVNNTNQVFNKHEFDNIEFGPDYNLNKLVLSFYNGTEKVMTVPHSEVNNIWITEAQSTIGELISELKQTSINFPEECGEIYKIQTSNKLFEYYINGWTKEIFLACQNTNAT